MNLEDFPFNSLFNFEANRHRQFFPASPLQMLGKQMAPWLIELLRSVEVSDQPIVKGQVHPSSVLEGAVYVGPGVRVEPHAYIQGPCFIGDNSEVRHGAYIRGHVYIGRSCVVGHTTEVKGSSFLDGAKAAHFAYVGDSVLGAKVNLGAGTKLANFKLRGDNIRIQVPETQQRVDTGLRKLGAIMGDHSGTGCNAVLDPGSILYPHTAVMPCVHFRGTLTKGFFL